MSVAWTAYRAIAPVLGAVAPAARVFVSSHERALWSERLGRVQIEEGCDAWVHAASLGEARAVGPLLRELTALRPAARYYLTAHTRAGRAKLLELGPPGSFAPIDSPQAVRRFLDGVRPALLTLIETELWPHWLLRARECRMPVAVVSARLSERSIHRYRRLGPEMRSLVGGLRAVLCQSEEDQRRWLALGATPECVTVVGNLKHDALPRAADHRPTARAALGLDPARPLLVLGSVRPGEARLLARAYRNLPGELRERWQVVAVPRHGRATRELMDEAASEGLAIGAEGAWRWDDTVGVLNDYYAAAEVAFVGGSLARFGGHNPIEPAACGAAVLIGPYHASQAQGVRALRARDAIDVVGAERELPLALREALEDVARCEARGRIAREVAEAMRGAARRAAAELAIRGLWAGRP